MWKVSWKALFSIKSLLKLIELVSSEGINVRKCPALGLDFGPASIRVNGYI